MLICCQNVFPSAAFTCGVLGTLPWPKVTQEEKVCFSLQFQRELVYSAGKAGVAAGTGSWRITVLHTQEVGKTIIPKPPRDCFLQQSSTSHLPRGPRPPPGDLVLKGVALWRVCLLKPWCLNQIRVVFTVFIQWSLKLQVKTFVLWLFEFIFLPFLLLCFLSPQPPELDSLTL